MVDAQVYISTGEPANRIPHRTWTYVARPLPRRRDFVGPQTLTSWRGAEIRRNVDWTKAELLILSPDLVAYVEQHYPIDPNSSLSFLAQACSAATNKGHATKGPVVRSAASRKGNKTKGKAGLAKGAARRMKTMGKKGLVAASKKGRQTLGFKGFSKVSNALRKFAQKNGTAKATRTPSVDPNALGRPQRSASGRLPSPNSAVHG